MRATTVTRFGPPEVLVTQDVPEPQVSPGEVVITVAAIDVLWVETLIRRGRAREYFDVTPPYLPGNAVAGVVDDAGPEVEPDWVGRTVVAHLEDGGGYAEQVAVPIRTVVAVPGGVDARTAAALSHDGVTALALADAAGITAGQRVLVVGASGGLGIVLVQLAKARGARVVATGRDPAKLARIRELGADAVIDTADPGWVSAARAALGGRGANVVLDNIGGPLGEAAFGAIAPGGWFSAHGTPGGRFARIDPAAVEALKATVRGISDVQLTAADRAELTRRILTEAAGGRVAPIIGQTFPLHRASDAHAAIENRAVFGKTLLLP